MAKLNYNWKRFWCPASGRMGLDNEGFLADPDGEYSRFSAGDVAVIDKFTDASCLVLLGEPGIGKSRTINNDKSALVQSAVASGGRHFSLDLKYYGDENRLDDDLFRDPVVQDWKQADWPLVLLLDSLDECRIKIPTLSGYLYQRLNRLPVERLTLRITCRSADWPSSFEENIKSLWGKEQVQVCELAPLRKVDVVEAVEANGLNAALFLAELKRTDAVPFAIKPVTLELLIKLFRKFGAFPSTQAELYKQGCLELCGEWDGERRDGRSITHYSSSQRLAAARRIAAVMQFSKRSAVWMGSEIDGNSDDVFIQSLTGGTEQNGGEVFSVGEDLVLETLRSGLFNSRGTSRLGWAHQTYAEFLAAQYLVESGMTLLQMMSLIVHPGDPAKKLVPQLHETSARLASLRPDVFRAIMDTDPQVLLRSDVTCVDDKDKAALTENLLRLLDEGKPIDIGRKSFSLSKLAYPNLAQQIKPYILGKNKDWYARYTAIDIAEDCKLEGIVDDLVNVALDPTDNIHVRESAAHGVLKLGDEIAKQRLKPLALGLVGDDPQDGLKGWGLQALWPNHIAAEEMLPLLTLPRNDNFYGSYKGFLYSHFVEHLKPEDFPTVLKWIDNVSLELLVCHPFKKIAGKIINGAWANLQITGVLEGLVSLLYGLLSEKKGSLLYSGDLATLKESTDDVSNRHMVITQLLSKLSADRCRKDIFKLAFRESGLVLTEDFNWFVASGLQAIDVDEKQKWAMLAERTFRFDDTEHYLTAFQVFEQDPVFAEYFGSYYLPVKVGSEDAERLKEYFSFEANRNKEKPLVEPPPKVRVEQKLAECEAGAIGNWWRLLMEMTREERGVHYREGLEADITKWPGWENADEQTHLRLLKIAHQYVLLQPSFTEKWLGTDKYDRCDYAAYRALYLLAQHDRKAFLSLSHDVWQKWVAITLAFPVMTGDESKLHDELAASAYKNAPEQTKKVLQALIKYENDNERLSIPWVIDRLTNCWDDGLSTFVIELIKKESLRLSFHNYLLQRLVARKYEPAVEFAWSLASFPLPETENERAQAKAALLALIGYAPEIAFEKIWPDLQKDVDTANEVIRFLAHRFDTHDGVEKGQYFSDKQLATLYEWIVRKFPTGDKPYEPNGTVSEDQQVQDYRDKIINRLRQGGAVEAIRHLIDEFPEREGLKWALAEAEQVALRDTWTPPQPADIIKLGTNNEKRFVQSGAQLLDVVIESLQRFEAELHDETPAIADLWNNVKGKRTPRNENKFSDRIKRHLIADLRNRGVIVNREVVIRDPMGGKEGERPDIKVEASVKSVDGESAKTVSVLIEVKGCFHSEVKTAMQTQLVDRYLEENHCQNGIYLVAWFKCSQWDKTDSRCNKPAKMELADARTFFDKQSAGLSQGTRQVRAFVMDAGLR